jgi:DNA polymerase V
MDKPTAILLGRCEAGKPLRLPLVAARISAGFPSGMEDFIERKIDLNEILVRHEAATYFIRVQGDSMTGAGIQDGDILIVDRSVEPANNSIVIAVLNGELTVKRLRRRGGRVFLHPENPRYAPLEVTAETAFEIWGVVRHVIHSV